MSATPVLIVAHARSAVVPVCGAFGALSVHELAAPVVRGLLQRANVPVDKIDALVMGNALGAGGNPARMVGLAAGLPDRCPALSIDTQCCSGLDAVAMGANMIASGQAHIVIAGGAEAWSRAPVRHHRPLHAGEAPIAYERPAFSPDPARDPDLLQAAAWFAQQQSYSRTQQNAYAQHSHQNALQHQICTTQTIVSVAEVTHDPYPRAIDTTRLPRIPLAAIASSSQHRHLNADFDCGVSQLAVSVKADGAAFVLLMSQVAAQRLSCNTSFEIMSHASVGHAPDMPLLAAHTATEQALQRAGLPNTDSLVAVELHDAFAVQGMHYVQKFALSPEQFNTHGGGLARGHPIGASGAVALVQLLSRFSSGSAPPGLGLVAIAAAGGVGSAMVVKQV